MVVDAVLVSQVLAWRKENQICHPHDLDELRVEVVDHPVEDMLEVGFAASNEHMMMLADAERPP